MVKFMVKSTPVTDLREAALDRVFSALSDTTRRRLVHRIAEGECSISELAAPFDMSLVAVSKHITVLEHAGLVRRRKEGRTYYCSLNPEALTGALDWITIYHQFWRQRFGALADMLNPPSTKDR